MFSTNHEKIKLYPVVKQAVFVSRLNRFTALVNCGKNIPVHLPTTGRMQELIYPGAEVFIIPAENSERKTAFDLVGVVRNKKIRVIDSRIGNALFPQLFQSIPLFQGWNIEKKEYTFGGSRFDFLMENEKGKKGLVEIKTCTILENGIAAFPDAPSLRAVKHLDHLDEARKEDYTGFLVILISGKADCFIPNFHTDTGFTQSFIRYYEKMNMAAVYYETDEDFFIRETGMVGIPIEHLKKINFNTGSYLIVYHLENKTVLQYGNQGKTVFEAGYYIYAGSAMNSLSARTSRHKNNVKNKHWHIDYIHPPMRHVKTYPFVSLSIECRLAEILAKQFTVIKGFGASDCKCTGHLFYTEKNPDNNRVFINGIFDMRFKPEWLLS